jgi:hypothetical protein
MDGVDDLSRQGRQKRVEVVDRFAAPFNGQPIPPWGSTDPGRHEGRLGDTHERVLHQQGHGGDRTEAGLFEPSIDRRLVGPDRGDDPVFAAGCRVFLRPGPDDSERERGERSLR